MRDKNRISNIVDSLENTWRLNSEMSFYNLIWNIYHDNDEQWTLYYKEDDYWGIYIEKVYCIDYDNLLNTNALSKTQKDLITLFKVIWEKYYDFRFPQICNLIYNFVNDKTSDEQVLEILKGKVGEILGRK